MLSFMNAGKRHKTFGSGTKDFSTAGTAVVRVSECQHDHIGH